MLHLASSSELWVIPMPADSYLREAWREQLARAESAGAASELSRQFIQCLAASLIECLDPDLKPPTEAQIAYAADITEELKIDFPMTALRYRGEMAAFIKEHVAAFKRKRLSKRAYVSLSR
jgi:hypothetical protein